MPIYEYACASCEHKFDKLQSITAAGADCPRCGQPARRAISLFSAVSTSNGGDLSALSGMGGCACSAGGTCGCAMG